MEETKTQLVLISMLPEQCPLMPPGPGAYWLGYLEVDIERKPEWILFDAFEMKVNLELSDPWIYKSMVEMFRIQRNEQSPPETRVTQSGFLFPITSHSGTSGDKISVPVTHWIIPGAVMQQELEALLEQTKARMISNRSNITLAPGNVENLFRRQP